VELPNNVALAAQVFGAIVRIDLCPVSRALVRHMHSALSGLVSDFSSGVPTVGTNRSVGRVHAETSPTASSQLYTA